MVKDIKKRTITAVWRHALLTFIPTIPLDLSARTPSRGTLEPMQEKKTRRQIFGITTYFDVGSTYF